ncbi:MAG TPA: glycerol-3-phosphate 1-O-acyltransferase PlsY [Candidatus Syntrophosphaera thermopropionivorans]|nr:glycerol-3-phosphate 1-O-acyltransferase PlsY [Candidatus Syntrophosphaera thermopropionivorans]HRC99641.1 glycerol-3-phosphate 1-O-acyltransferase PlsY [Candidatus Syntrophosphaera thermopropionivorans]
MNLTLLWIILCICAYLIGSIPFGYIIGMIFHHQDIRKGGSGNIGATNALRLYGALSGIAVLILDFLKGFIVAWLLYKVVPDKFGYLIGDKPLNAFIFNFPALMVILGHMYSVFLSFKGGKGVSTALGVFIYIATIPMLLSLIVFLIVVAITRYVSLGSIVTAFSFFIIDFLWNILVIKDYTFPWFQLTVVLLIIYKHYPNILRLLEHQETKISFKKGQ